jgi:hypothetical protein
VKVGDKVKLVGIPPDTRDREDMQTRTLFKRCLGRVFKVTELEHLEGLLYPLARLAFGHVVGKKRYSEVIWVEPEFLKILQ